MTTTQYDYVDAIMAYEEGELDRDGTIELFQYLVDTGLAWSFQGSYGRMAEALIREGYVTARPEVVEGLNRRREAFRRFA